MKTEVKEVEQISIENPFKKFVPILTIIFCAASIVLFIGINFERQTYDWEVLKKWGAPSATDIFDGNYWGLISSNFLHVQLWHIAFNLYWLWIFGKKIEYESNKIFYCLLIISSALVSSLSQLSFADTTGIGLSGIGYSLFGFILVKSRTTESYKNYLEKKTIRFLIFWLFLCIVLTKIEVWNVGNAAHVGGFLWGMTLAYISGFNAYKQWLVGFGSLSLLVSSIFWNPLSTSWLSYQAEKLHNNEKFEEAIVVYKKILSRNPQDEAAKVNLELLQIHKLQEKAYDLHSSEKYLEARKVYHQILKIDPEEQWTIENLKRLPDE